MTGVQTCALPISNVLRTDKVNEQVRKQTAGRATEAFRELDSQ